MCAYQRKKYANESFIDNGKETVVILMRHMTVTLSIIERRKNVWIQTSHIYFMNIYFDFSHLSPISACVCANWISERRRRRRRKIQVVKLRVSERMRSTESSCCSHKKHSQNEWNNSFPFRCWDNLPSKMRFFTWAMSWFFFALCWRGKKNTSEWHSFPILFHSLWVINSAERETTRWWK